MDEPYIGEIRIISSSYAPKGWAFCNGQLLPINQNQALFSLLGTTFGGNGQTNFGLPDLRSRVPVGAGQVPNGTNYVQGMRAGTESVSLLTNQIPSHTHAFTGTLQTSTDPEDISPVGNFPAKGAAQQYSAGPGDTTMLSGPLAGNTGATGNGMGHENRMPVQAINYVIALTGNFPSRE
ncbi:phage tail protein [Hymenobacter jeollabukensis]|uniref:Phage tail protein n=1 Tax=Hymenobacter jeollabukensis TaxID=2025313 RepID=A0A5R8WRX2_9BACT|nr:tail fiber protein [Hymenobacter jeollabukensis]TLM93930.1 phage tail protein [Hymenobacter jeollabukensis]